MRVVRDWERCPPQYRGAVIALGNFDGVHRGHMAVLRETLCVANSHGLKAAAMTFEPHPRRFFAPDAAPIRIYPFRTKADLITRMGMDFLLVLRFNHALAELSAEQFVRKVLVEGLGIAHVVTGGDFMFGKGRQGDAAFLASAAGTYGFAATAVSPALDAQGAPYSSSRIRQKLAEGDMAGAGQILGRPYTISGRVVHGDGRGRTLGFPTANVHFGRIFLPAFGVYAVRVKAGGRHMDGVANLGLRPSFNGQKPVLEAHCFDFCSDLYEQRVEIEMVVQLRGERRFPDMAALAAQIHKDCVQAKEILAGGATQPFPKTDAC